MSRHCKKIIRSGAYIDAPLESLDPENVLSLCLAFIYEQKSNKQIWKAHGWSYKIFLSNTNYNGFETSTLPELSYPSTKLIFKKNCNLLMITRQLLLFIYK